MSTFMNVWAASTRRNVRLPLDGDVVSSLNADAWRAVRNHKIGFVFHNFIC